MSLLRILALTNNIRSVQSSSSFLLLSSTRQEVISTTTTRSNYERRRYRHDVCSFHSTSTSRRRRTFVAASSSSSSSSIDIYNEQNNLRHLDIDKLRQTIASIRHLLGYDNYAVQVVLVNDHVMTQRNYETRGIRKSTDILSFPFLECDSSQPGTVRVPRPFANIPDYYNLGDCLIDVPYVMRRTREDYNYYEHEPEGQDGDDDDDDECASSSKESNDDDDDDDYDYSDLYYDDDDRGVSGAMARVYDAEERIHMLMVHGMLHLVGYDHETDDDYELMVAKEEEILQQLGFIDDGKKNKTRTTTKTK